MAVTQLLTEATWRRNGGSSIRSKARHIRSRHRPRRGAVTHHLYAEDLADEESPPWQVLYLGPDRTANLLEVVVIEGDDGIELAIHAMKMRRGYACLINPSRRRCND
jgi:hypothetical protein